MEAARETFRDPPERKPMSKGRSLSSPRPMNSQIASVPMDCLTVGNDHRADLSEA